MMRRVGAPAQPFLSVLAITALHTAACAGGSFEGEPSRQSPARQAGTLVVAVPSDMEGINPILSGSTGFSSQIHGLLFLRLFEEQPDFKHHPPTFAPLLARRWDFSPDRRTLDIELRRDVHWSDGRPVTSDDVVWTWRAQTDPRVAWPHAYLKDSIVAVQARGPSGVRVLYSHAYPGQLADLNVGPILPSHAWSDLPFERWRTDGAWFRRQLVTSGPFRLSAWRPGEEIVLERNPAYYESALPRLDRVVFRVLPDPASRILQLRGKAVDFVDGVPPVDAERLRAGSGLEIRGYWTRHYTYLCWNTMRPWFGDASVRRALTQAIDRERLVAALWRGHARVGVSPILQSVWAVDTELDPWPYDPAQASALLSAAGWIESAGTPIRERDGQPFRFELLVNADNPLNRDAVALIQQDLRQVGVDARIRTLEFQTLNELTEAHRFDAFLGTWAIDTNLDLRYAFHTESIASGYNFGSYSDVELDILIDRARAASTPAEARPHLQQIQRILHRDQPYTFLWEPQRMAVASARLEGAQPNALSPYFRLHEWRLEPAQR